MSRELSDSEIRDFFKEMSATDVLREVVAYGTEYPDAVWRVTRVLRLRKDEVAEMEQNYSECI